MFWWWGSFILLFRFFSNRCHDIRIKCFDIPSSSPSDIVRGTWLTARKRALLAMLMVESGIQDYFGSYICTNSKPISQFPLTDEAVLELIATKPLFKQVTDMGVSASAVLLQGIN